MEKVGCYIHIPFCEKKCYYCDFAAFSNLEGWIDGYIDNLIKEIQMYRKNMDLAIDSIYIGGGTPSYIDDNYIKQIVEETNKFPTDIKEFTIECNPNSIDRHKLETYKKLGVTRISLGVQSFDDKVLKNIGRNHTSEIAINDILLIKEFGFDLSFDLMLNLPGQDFASVKNDLEMVKKLKPDHISWYSLILDKGSLFYNLDKKGKLDLMDTDLEVDIFSFIVDELEKLGLSRYEVSNFSRKDKESIHNKKYWNIDGYVSFGLAAAGFLSNTRYTNVRNFVKYDKLIKSGKYPIAESEFISSNEREKEYIIFKLRETEGINLEIFREKFGYDFLDKYEKAINKFKDQDFFEINSQFSFTKKGMSLSNEFFIEII